jgi:glycosyltransferase involved in cell wall biosynthesis
MNGVSVIICCYNSAQRLGETIKHLARQETNGVAWEIVLVDNASTDNTKDVALALWTEFGRTNVPLKIVDQPVPGLSFARSKGIEASNYDVFLFCDDDNWLDENYVHTAYTLMKGQPGIGALGGNGIAVTDGLLPAWFDQYKYCYACYRQGDIDGELKGRSSSLYGAGLVIKREVIESLAAEYRPILTDRIGSQLSSGGDTELSFAIRLKGYKLWFSEELVFKHYMPQQRLTMTYLMKINRSLAFCGAKLIVHRYVLEKKKVSEMVWLKDLSYKIFLFVKSLIRISTRKMSSFERKMDLDYAYFSLLGILSLTGKYSILQKNLINLSSERQK